MMGIYEVKGRLVYKKEFKFFKDINEEFELDARDIVVQWLRQRLNSLSHRFNKWFEFDFVGKRDGLEIIFYVSEDVNAAWEGDRKVVGKGYFKKLYDSLEDQILAEEKELQRKFL
jgi:hypothetical protein